jgi:hypothetical protein
VQQLRVIIGNGVNTRLLQQKNRVIAP